MWHYYDNMMGWGFGFGWLGMIIFWGLIIWGFVVLMRGIEGRGCSNFKSEEKKPLDILKERYAKGEISKEEFDKMKKDLE